MSYLGHGLVAGVRGGGGVRTKKEASKNKINEKRMNVTTEAHKMSTLLLSTTNRKPHLWHHSDHQHPLR